MTIPSHHLPGGGFRNPWPDAASPERGLRSFLRWQVTRLRDGGLEPAPPPEALPLAPADVAYPRATPEELRITWVGHSTFLVQVGGWNVLTDPVWSDRASPVQWLGPRRLVPPGLAWDALPEIDAVLISHDHYDHLDRDTVRRLYARYGAGLRWFAPLGFPAWFAAQGIGGVRALDWWEETRLADGPPGTVPLRLVATPAQHWSRRSPLERGRARLWCGWVLHAGDTRLFFAGDTGFFPEFPEIGARLGPFRATALPIGAYAPRWFMRAAHMDPGDAVRAYRELGGHGRLVPMHWGTFRLTDEPVLEPPRLLREQWREAALPQENLALLRHGQTAVLPAGTE